jgi:heat-inducible transcriptional repressor
MITELNDRSREIFRYIVDAYLQTGATISSNKISEELNLEIAPSTIRNVMAQLEENGLLFSPHTSSGRIPSQKGLQLYVDGIMEVGNLSKDEIEHIEMQCAGTDNSIDNLLNKASLMLSGLSAGAGLVTAPKLDKPLQQIQFVKIDPKKVLCILVMKGGIVENRVLEFSNPINESALISAMNYLNQRILNKTLNDAKADINKEIKSHKLQLDEITKDLVSKGLALDPTDKGSDHLIIKGQSKLLEDLSAIEDLERARVLFEALEEETMIETLLHSAQKAEGVQIFIGSENKIFEHSGWSMVLSPYKNEGNNIVGAIGVIAPTRTNYGKIIPMIDYTSKVISRLISEL